MEIYKFFNSAPGDARTYQAADFADYFGSVLSTGLLHTDNIPGMNVSVSTGTLKTIVSPGKAIMEGHLYENTTPLTLTHSLPEATLNRIDRIVLRLDLRNSERNIKLHVKAGIASASPVSPTLQRDNFIYEISLARVLVRANTVQLLAGDLVDERLDESLAGLVHSLISIPTSQFQAEWDAFMAGIEDSGFASAEELATHKADYLKHTGYAVATGSANTYVATLNPALSAYAEGVSLRLKINIANTGASTVNVNGLGAKTIKKSNGNAVASGNLKAGSVYTLAYDGTSFILQGEGGEYGTAVAGDVRSTKTLGTEAGVVQGTLNLSNLTPNNIKSGVTIDGVTGIVAEGGMSIPHNTNLGNKYFTGIDSDDKIYLVDVGVSPYVGRIYDKNFTLLQTVTHARDIRGISPEGYTATSPTHGAHGADCYNLTGTLLGSLLVSGVSINPSTGFAISGGVYVVGYSTTSSIYLYTMSGTILSSLAVNSTTRLLRNKKGNVVFSQTLLQPHQVGKWQKDTNVLTMIQGATDAVVGMDLKNW